MLDAVQHIEYSLIPGSNIPKFDLFPQGMAESKEFAGELFVALSRRRKLDPAKGVTKDELSEFWEEMNNQNFNSRLRIFFDM